MWLFASYSRKDETAVQELISDLQRAHLSVWHDQELRGGEPWWQDILGRIRQCDVVLFLLSHNSLASKPCLTELSYAKALGLPILPVQVGPVGNLRLTPVADIQVTDYQERTLAKGMELLNAIQQAATERHPLPEPLPEPPPVPFEYLLRLGTAIGAAQLTPDQQGDFIRQLRDCLETEDDEGVRDDARELLRALRRRPDITYRNAQAIDQLLADLATPHTGETDAGQDDREPPRTDDRRALATDPGAPIGYGLPSGPAYFAAPSGYPSRGGATGYPPHGGDPGGTKPNRLPLVLGGIAVLAMLVLGVVGVVAATAGSSSDASEGPAAAPTTMTTTPAPSPGVDPEKTLLAALPRAYDADDCRTLDPAGDGDIAGVGCGAPRTQPGPQVSNFFLYEDGDAVDDVFLADAQRQGLTEVPALADCPTTQGFHDYRMHDRPAGRVACYVADDNRATIVWTQENVAVEGFITIPNGGTEGLNTLWAWWNDPNNSDFVAW